jgi:hypothetical protein
LVCIGLDGYDIFHVSCTVSSNDGHTLLWLWKMCIWLRKGYIGYRKIWWGHGCTTPPYLHWYTTIVTRRRCCAPPSWVVEEPSPIILPLLFFFDGTRIPSSNQSSFPPKKKS